MATSAPAPNQGASLLDQIKALQALVEAQTAHANPAPTPAATGPAKVKAATVQTTKAKGKITTTVSGHAVNVLDAHGDVEAAMDGGVVVIRLTLNAGGHVSASGRSTVHASGSVRLTDGSRITLSHFTPTAK